MMRRRCKSSAFAPSSHHLHSYILYYCFDVLAGFVGEAHNREHWIDAGGRREDAAITHKQPFHTMQLPVSIGYRCFGVGTHAAAVHLVCGEHHHAIYAHAVPLQLSVKRAELLFCDRATFWPIQARAFVVRGNDGPGSRGEMRTG